MNEFDQKIRSAKRKNLTLYLVIGAVAGLVGLAYILFLLLARGYAIVVVPQDARATQLIHLEQGVGFVMGEKVYSFSSLTQIQVGAHLYQSRTLSLTPQSPRVVEVELEPAPAQLEATVSAGSKHTAWSLDGELIHLGPTLKYSLPPGEYQLIVDDPFYQSHQMNLALEKGQQQTINIELKPIFAKVRIQTRPAGADVIIDGVLVGQSPVTIEKTGGAYSLETQFQGYEHLTDVIEVTNKQKFIERNYLLPPKKGLLNLSVSPEQGTLLINGEQVEAGEHWLAANQRHSVRYVKKGYYPLSKKVQLKPEQILDLSLDLKAEMGRVIMQSKLLAEIYLNGKKLSPGNQSLNLQALPHQVEFRKQGYRSIKRSVTPQAGKTQQLDVILLTEFEARRKEGRSLFISDLGIKMSRFQPTGMVMGSPVNEKGRRRNEFQVPVDFNRPIWVSQHEITETQYGKFRPGQGNTRLPVTNISWNDAALYCNWLSEKEGLPAFYRVKNGKVSSFNSQSKGYRLLMEAEWEWLAKKARRSSQTRFVWGNQERIPKKSGNYGDQSIKGKQAFYLKDYDDGYVGKAPVGSYRADRAGLFDLSGNVAEWVNDYYTNLAPDTNKVHNNYTGARTGKGHVAKGGHYLSGRMLELRVAYREPPEQKSDTVGFRIARFD